MCAGCIGDYQYERQPSASFTHCNPVRTSLQLGCSVLVPSDSTTVTVDWYWSKNISECVRYITEEQGRFTITTNRGLSHIINIDRISTDLTITSPETDSGYYWYQVNDPSFNGIFIPSNKAPVFDTGTMTICSGIQSTFQPKCAVGSVPPLICVDPTSSFVLAITSITTYFVQSTTTIPSIPPYVTSTTNTGNNAVFTSTIPTETLIINDFSQLTYMSSTMSLSYNTPSVASLGSNCYNEGLVSGLVVLDMIIFALGGVLGGLLTVLWNKWRHRKGICHIHVFNNYYNSLDVKNPSRKEIRSENYYFIKKSCLVFRSIPNQPDVLTTEDNTAYGLTVFSQDTSVTDPPSDYIHVYDTPQQ